MDDFFTQVLRNLPILCAICAWFVAQLLKVIIVLIENKKIDFSRFIGSGGMPSSHSAFVSALATSIGVVDGFHSSAFAIAFVLAFIVMYDASGVRRAAGEQAKIINRMAKNMQEGLEGNLLEKDLKELLGHSPFEVFVGLLVGIAVTLVIMYY